MPLSSSGEYSEVDEGAYVAAVVSVTNAQAEAKAAGSRLTGRQSLFIYNKSAGTVYFGPTGVTTSTGIALLPFQFCHLSIGNIAVYLIAATAGPFDVVVHESA